MCCGTRAPSRCGCGSPSTAGALALEVRNPLPAAIPGPGRGSGLRGIRERAALLGGSARTGPDEGEWLVHAELPLG